MPPSLQDDSPTQSRATDSPACFATTHWSVVLAAGNQASPDAQQALERLCRTYWYPLYAYVRRKDYSVHDAQDLTQEFFARLLTKQQVAGADRRKGKFRSWLLGIMNHFLAHEWEKARAQKRGSGLPVFSLEELEAETRYGLEPQEPWTAQRIFDRRWALTLMEQAAARLRAEYSASGKDDVYACLKGFVSGEGSTISYEETARRLGMTEGGAKAAVHRLRRHYQELVREEIAQTVTNAAEIEEEIRYLLAVLRG